jgi:hypothetical protein
MVLNRLMCQNQTTLLNTALTPEIMDLQFDGDCPARGYPL